MMAKSPAPRIKQVPIAELKAADYNPRSMSAQQMERLQSSLQEFGAVQPAVINSNGTIIGGHQRIEAAQALGWRTFPTVEVDLDPDRERLLNLALNRISADWDEERLAELIAEIDEGADLGLSGFDDRELQRMLDSVGGIEEEAPDPKPLPRRPKTKAGDLYELGVHRLLCGDVRSRDAWTALMQGKQAAAVWTDPPYGVDYVGKTEDAMRLENDQGGGLAELLSGAFTRLDEVLSPGGVLYIAHPAGPGATVFGQAFAEAGWRHHQTLVWVKDTMVLGHSDYHYRHEPILLGYKPGKGRHGRGGKGWYGGDDQTSVLEYERPKASREHPTTKPVPLVEHCLRNSTKKGDVVLDPFCGSGSTVIAADRLGRRCFAMDVDPAYCDVAVARWEAATGEKAKRGRRG